MSIIREISRFDTDNQARCSVPGSNDREGSAVAYGLSTVEAVVDQFLIDQLTPGLKLTICGLLDRGQSKADIMRTVEMSCGDVRSIVAMGCDALIDMEIERRMYETDR